MKASRLAKLALAFGLAISLLSPLNSARAQAGTGTIAGQVLDTNLTAIPGVNVCALNADVGGTWICGQTGADGKYTITGLDSADYRVEAYAEGWGLEYYNGVFGWYAASRVTVSLGSTTSGIDFALVPGGQISGTVYQADGITPIPNIIVSIAAPDYSRVVCTDASGQYGFDFVAYGVPWKIGAGTGGCGGGPTGYGAEY